MKNPLKPAVIAAETAILWNRLGKLTKDSTGIIAKFASREIRFYGTGNEISETQISSQTPYLAFSMSKPIAILMAYSVGGEFLRANYWKRMGNS